MERRARRSSQGKPARAVRLRWRKSIALTSPGVEAGFRVGTWNCRMGVDSKSDFIRGLSADVVVVPECRSDPQLATEPNVDFRWSGLYPRQGLGVFAFGGWRLTPLRRRGSQPWCLPVAVWDPTGKHAFDLLAVWTIAGGGRPGYGRQFTETLDLWEARLGRPQMVVAGDLNDSLPASASGVPSPNLSRLREVGIGSAYHVTSAVGHGDEVQNTLRWIGRGRIAKEYHIDFVFLSPDLISRLTAVDVGSMLDWVESGRSDHCPVVAAIGPE